MKRVHPAASVTRGYPRLRAGWQALLAAAPLALSAPALADVTPPPAGASERDGAKRAKDVKPDAKLRAQPGAWMLEDELLTRAVAAQPVRVPVILGAMVSVAPPAPPAVLRVPMLPFVGEKRDRAEVQGTDSVLDFIDDTIDAGDLVSRFVGRTVVKRVGVGTTGGPSSHGRDGRVPNGR